MATDKTVSFPVRLPSELDAEIQKAADLTGISKQDLMRLCLRIGLVDLRAAEHDLPGIVKKIADDKGVSFEAFAQHKKQQHLTASIHGTISVPVIKPTAEQKSSSVLNEDSPPPPELESNRLRRRLDAAKKGGSATR